jgi:hypothetical protein
LYSAPNANPDGENPDVRGLVDLVHPEAIKYGRQARTAEDAV